MNGFMQDGNGNRSSMRLLAVGGTAFILAVWGVVSVRSGALAPMPLEVAGIVAALVGGKVTQGWIEGKAPQS